MGQRWPYLAAALAAGAVCSFLLVGRSKRTDKSVRAGPSSNKATAASPVHDRRIPALPDQHDKPSGVGPSALMQIVSQQYAAPGGRAAAIISNLEASGSPSNAFLSAGERIETDLKQRGLVTKEWQCFRDGCYFRAKTEIRQSEQAQIVQTRDKYITGSTIIVTGDPVPNKVIVLVSGTQ